MIALQVALLRRIGSPAPGGGATSGAPRPPTGHDMDMLHR